MKRTTAILTTLGLACVMVMAYALPAMGQTNPVDEHVPPIDGADSFQDVAENIGTGAVDFLFVSGYTPWAAMVVNAGDPNGVDMVTLSFDEESDTLNIELTDSNTTNHATVLVNKAFAEKYIGDDPDFKLSDAVNYQGMQEGNETAENAMYVFQVEHFSTQTIEISDKASGLPHPGIFAIVLITLSIAAVIGRRKRDK